jgi:hypothetical protein
MRNAWSVASLAFIAALAACSGNIGGGQSTLPGGPASPQSNAVAPVPTPTPVSASNIASVGPDETKPQPLPTVAGYGGTITFAKPSATGTPNPKATSTSNAGPIPVGVTAAIVEPTDAPQFNPVATARKHRLIGNRKDDPTSPKALLFVTLLSTQDVTFEEYPRIAIDVPRDIVTKYRDGTFGLALFDPSDKAKRYRMAVSERDLSTPAPGSVATVKPSAAPTATPTARPSPSPGATGTALTPPPVATAAPTPTLPPERISFNGTAATLFLKANRPVVFALYAIPQPPTPAPTVAPSGAPHSPAPSPASSSLPSPVPSPTGS